MQTVIQVVVILAALGSALVGGVFFSFSTLVMRALGDLPAPSGIAAMQRINAVVINPWFMTPFLGTAVLGIALMAMRICQLQGVSTLAAFGGGLYVVGTFGVTLFGNVPLNNRLAALDPSPEPSAIAWAAYQRDWTRWNHLRTIAAIASATVVGM